MSFEQAIFWRDKSWARTGDFLPILREPCSQKRYGSAGVRVFDDATRFFSLAGLAEDGDGGAYVLWTEGRPGTDWIRRLALQHVTADGALDWAAPQVLVDLGDATIGRVHASISADARGGCVVAWMQLPGNIAGGVPMLQRFDRSGNALWAADGLAAATDQGAVGVNPSLVPDGAGGCVLVWTSIEPLGLGGSPQTIFAQYADADGELRWSSDGILVAQLTGRAYTAGAARSILLGMDVCADGSGGAFIAWRQPASGEFKNQYFVRHVDAAGNLTAAYLFRVETVPGQVSMRWSMSGDGTGGFFVLCAGSRDLPLEVRHYAAQTGNRFWTPPAAQLAPVPTWVPGLAVRAAVPYAYLSPDQHKGALVAWVVQAPDQTLALEAQRLAPQADPQWNPAALAIGLEERPQFFNWARATLAAIVPNGGGGGILVWNGYAGPAAGVLHYRCITALGSFAKSGEVATTALRDVTSRVRPDGKGGAIAAWEDGPDMMSQTFGVLAQRAHCCEEETRTGSGCVVSDAQLTAFAGSGRVGVSLACYNGDLETSMGIVPVPKICQLISGVDCPGCLHALDMPCPGELRMLVEEVPPGVSVSLYTSRGQKVGDVKALPGGGKKDAGSAAKSGGYKASLRFRPDRKNEYALVFRRKGDARRGDVFPVRVRFENVIARGKTGGSGKVKRASRRRK